MLKIFFVVRLVCGMDMYAQYVSHDGDVDSTFPTLGEVSNFAVPGRQSQIAVEH